MIRLVLLACLASALALLGAAPAHARAKPIAPGVLISATAMKNAPKGARAWRIVYWSRSDTGVPEKVTGYIAAPAGPAPREVRPVIGWAHGTWGVTDACTPSTSPKVFTATPWLSKALAQGFVVAATDYAGLGTPDEHPYLVADSAAHSVLDAVRAARQIAQAGAGDRFIPWGESQGGHAALFAGLRARDYAPELRLAGVAAAAPPTDLAANLGEGTDPSIRAFMIAYATYSWSRHYGIPMATIAKPQTVKLIDRIAQNCVTLGAKPKLGFVIGVAILRARLKGVDLSKVEPWAGIGQRNSVPATLPGVPMLIAQTREDPIVAPAVTRDYARRICARGATVRFIDLPGGNHGFTAADSADDTLAWMADRLAGRTAPNDCGRL